VTPAADRRPAAAAGARAAAAAPSQTRTGEGGRIQVFTVTVRKTDYRSRILVLGPAAATTGGTGRPVPGPQLRLGVGGGPLCSALRGSLSLKLLSSIKEEAAIVRRALH